MSLNRQQYTNKYELNPQGRNYGYPPQKKEQPTYPKETVYNEKMDRNEVQELKRKVQEINYQMNKRKRAVLKIQKVWRGYLARKRFKKIK